MNKNIDKMAKMDMRKLIIVMSIPAITSMLVQALYNVIDSMFLAQIGQEALTALSLAFPIQLLLVSVATGLSIGINSYVSRKIGEGDMKEAANAAEHGVVIAIAAWLVIVVLNYFLIERYVAIFTTDPLTFKYALQYLNIVVYGSIGFILSLVLISIQQATGEMVSSMKVQIVGALINIVLDPIMIFGWLIFPQLDVVGGALATVIGQVVSMLYALKVVHNNPLKLELKKLHVNFKMDKDIVKEILKVGLPSMLFQGLNALTVSSINYILVGLSVNGVAVYGAVSKTYAIIIMPVIGLTQGMMPVVGFNFGAKIKKRVIDAVKYSIIYTVCFMLLGSICFSLLAKPLMSLFSDNPELVAMGVTCTRIISLGFALLGCSVIIISAFQAFGVAWISLISSFSRQILLILPLAYFLGMHYGVVGVWSAFPLTEAISLIITGIFAYKIYHSQIAPKLVNLPV